MNKQTKSLLDDAVFQKIEDIIDDSYQDVKDKKADLEALGKLVAIQSEIENGNLDRKLNSEKVAGERKAEKTKIVIDIAKIVLETGAKALSVAGMIFVVGIILEYEKTGMVASMAGKELLKMFLRGPIKL